METQILEGTLTEIQRQLSDLPYAPETRVRVTIEEAGPKAATKRTRNGITLVPVKTTDTEASETPAHTAQPFRPTEFRNGVPLLPHRETTQPVTTELVKRLLDEEDEEWLRAHRSGGCEVLSPTYANVTEDRRLRGNSPESPASPDGAAGTLAPPLGGAGVSPYGRENDRPSAPALEGSG